MIIISCFIIDHGKGVRFKMRGQEVQDATPLEVKFANAISLAINTAAEQAAKDNAKGGKLELIPFTIKTNVETPDREHWPKLFRDNVTLQLGEITYTGRIMEERYKADDSIALEFVASVPLTGENSERDAELIDGEPITRLTVCVPGALKPVEGKRLVLIKNYGLEEGLLDQLVKLGIVKDTGGRVKTGFIELPICELLYATSNRTN